MLIDPIRTRKLPPSRLVVREQIPLSLSPEERDRECPLTVAAHRWRPRFAYTKTNEVRIAQCGLLNRLTLFFFARGALGTSADTIRRRPVSLLAMGRSRPHTAHSLATS